MFNLYNINDKTECEISLTNIKNLLPKSINNRDLRLLQNGIRGDISYLLYKDDTMLIKFDCISVIIVKKKAYCINFKDEYSSKFIEYLKKLTFNKNDIEKLLFENILHYISEKNDDFLDKSYNTYSELSLDKFKSKQLPDILHFQHNILLEKNKNQEYYESLIELLKNENNLNFLNNNKKNINKKNINNENKIKNIVHSFINRFKEDIKNIDRLNREIDFFIELINIKLAGKRNNYAFKSLRLEMVSCSYSLSCFLIYMFGSNLKNHIEDNDYAFFIIMSLVILLNIPIYIILYKIFK